VGNRAVLPDLWDGPDGSCRRYASGHGSCPQCEQAPSLESDTTESAFTLKDKKLNSNQIRAIQGPLDLFNMEMKP